MPACRSTRVAYLAAVAGYYTTTDGQMLSLPYNSSTPVLYVNRDALKAAGLDPEMDLSTWEQVGGARRAQGSRQRVPADHRLAELGPPREPLSLSQRPLRHEGERFGGLDTELTFNGPVQVEHIDTMGQWARTASSSTPVAATKAAPTSAPANARCSPKARRATPV
jgi:sn-glycerol 3-phosphate transport system substrate-binding protein